MKKLLFALLLLVPSLHAATWYIRPDGGTNTQCTGKTNAAYPGTGSAQACAFNHPFQMLSYSGAWTALAGGDTIQFVNTSGTSDTYFLGEQNSGVGTDWHTQLGGICPAANSGYPGGASCILPALPSGTSGNPTQVIGQNAGSCHDATHQHLVNPTILSGIGGAFSVMDTRATNYVTISCIAITQPDTCTNSTGGSGQCSSTNNYVKVGGLIQAYSGSAGATNLTLTDFGVFGISGDGIEGSTDNSLSSSGVKTFNDVHLAGNGGDGYNSDSGGCDTSCEGQGTFNVHYSTFDWSGCVAVKPYNFNASSSANTYNYCHDDDSGGDGDNFVLIATGNETVNVDHSFFRWGAQDGFDSLHLGDDLSTNPNVTVTDSWAEGNMGQTFKEGAGATNTAINNVSISNCRVMATASNFPSNPTGWNAELSDFCRASGGAWVFAMKAGTVVTVLNNTSIGYSTTMWNWGCSESSPSTCVSTGGAYAIFKNNMSYNYPDPGNAGVYSSDLFFGNGNPFTNPGGSASNNGYYLNKQGCPDSQYPSETGTVCTNPLITSTAINAINPNLQSGSPMIGAGVAISGVTNDYNGNSRPSSPSIGAFELVGGTPTVATPTSTPPAGSFTGSVSVTLATTTPSATICYTTDGTTPTATTAGTCSHGTPYSSAISLSSTTTLNAIGTLSGDTNSSLFTGTFTVIPLVATPSCTPTAGTYTSAQTVTCSSTTSGSTTYCTINGAAPTTSSPVCTSIAIASTVTLKAISAASGATNSAIISQPYTINPTRQYGLKMVFYQTQ